LSSRGAFVLGLWGLGWAACSPSPAPRAASPGIVRPPAASPSVSGLGPAVDERSVSANSVTHVALLETAQLRVLEARGFGFSELAVNQSASSTAELSRLPALHGLFAALQGDVKAAARPYPLARVTSSDGFRLFDARWLSSGEMRFVLSGVFNRLDRRPFYAASCGEVRFVYRLAYATSQGGAPLASRLPMTLNVVFWVDAESDETCQAAARQWQSPAQLSNAQLLDWLVSSGPLGSAARARWRMKSIESNLQTFRLQSSVHPSLAGHIEYDLRVFHPKDAARSDFAPAAMENTPDVAGLKRDHSRAQELLTELRRPETLRELDRGTLMLADRFLASQASSFAPRGLERRANRPFSELFEEQDFRDLDLSSYESIRSPAALLRRLDAASCSGCHQSRSIAGFHHVGKDDADEPTFNALFSGSSAHLGADLERRRRYVDDLAAGIAPDERRPLPERQGVGSGQGAPCGLGDSGFADWKCDDGYTCTKLEDPLVGTCLAPQAVGAPCEYGKMVPSSAPQRDRIAELGQHACSESERCSTNFSGFPQGACTASCNSGEPNRACADYLDVDGFQNCLRNSEPYVTCAKKFVFGVGVQACDEQHACRQDYVCTRTQRSEQGACLPPYFVYQLRLDGYPLKH
jgi:hypothetical protein